MAKLTAEDFALREREVELETKELNLEVLRDNVKHIRARQERQQMSHAQVESALKEFVESQERGFLQCNHRKGGKNLEGARGRGTDDKYAIIRHQLPIGDLAVICTRCHKVWLPTVLCLLLGIKADPEAYRQACEWPTDNEDSGSALFVPIKGGKEVK